MKVPDQSNSRVAPLREHLRKCAQCRNNPHGFNRCKTGQRMLLQAIHQLLYARDEKLRS